MKDYYIIDDNRYSTTAIYKDKIGRWIYATTYMSGYGKGHRKEITLEQVKHHLKEFKIKE